jgi:hypothetical protein
MYNIGLVVAVNFKAYICQSLFGENHHVAPKTTPQ